MDIKVKKRNGRLEEFQVDKINASAQRACEDIEDVSASEIVLDAQLQLFDKITTKEMDTALILSLCHFLLENDLYDKDFIESYTVGSKRYFSYLLGKSDGIVKDIKWASKICKIPEDKIINLAKKMSSNKTMISLSWSLTRQQHGEQPYWAGITLACMLGQIGTSGGGVGFGYSAVNSVGNNVTPFKYPSFPQKKNPVLDFIPVARFSDMLLNPNKKFKYNGQVLVYPKIEIVYWAGGNPFHHHQDLNKMIEAWKKPKTIIINEWCWNTTAKFADIILPCTTTFEREDISISSKDNYIVSMEKIIPPVGNSKNDYEIFSDLSDLMGVKEIFTELMDAGEWQEKIYNDCRKVLSKKYKNIPSYKEFRKRKWFKVNKMQNTKIMLKEFRNDPIKNPLKTPSGKIEIFSDKIKSFNYTNCPPHPAWLEPKEWLGNKRHIHKFHLLSNQPREKLHSQYDHGAISKSLKIKNRQTAIINFEDAKELKIKNKDSIKVFNSRGACVCSAIISKYLLNIDITSKALKNKLIEVNITFKFEDKEPNEKKSYFEIVYAAIVRINDGLKEKKELEKIILCDVPNKLYPELENSFLNLVHNSGHPEIKLEKKVDFNKLYNDRFN